MAYSEEIVIETKELVKEYDGFVLRIPSLSIRQGEFIGLIGENGAGKSTLIKLILNLIDKDSGVIRINGQSIIDSSIKKEIGVVFDQCCFSGNLCIEDLNKIFKNIYKSLWNEKQYFDNALRLSLPLEKPIITFSQGMKAKLNIISALAHTPKLLILDEATSNLDPVVRREINEMISGYSNQTGCTVLFSSHLVNELELFCDRIILMDNGSIMLTTCIEELQGNYYIAKVETTSTIPKKTLAWIRKKNHISCLIYGRPSSMDDMTITRGVSTDILMYYLKKGERVV